MKRALRKPPEWWQHPPEGLKGAALRAAGFCYGIGTRLRWAVTTPYRSTLPVICIGNFTVGGGGKTPLSIAVARHLKSKGHKPAFLTRGYGGTTPGPHLVVPEKDDAEKIGDEPLLLAQHAPTWISRDRAVGARAVETSAATVIIMDDGFQNPRLEKDLSLIAIDASSRAPFGNAQVFPAGPLRAPRGWQQGRADAVVTVGTIPKEPHLDLLDIIKTFGHEHHIEATIAPVQHKPPTPDTRHVAFCGIARPEKFFETLADAGYTLAQTLAFPDHHPFTPEELSRIQHACQHHDAIPITTRKDAVRLASFCQLPQLEILEIEIVFDTSQIAKLDRLLSRALPDQPA